VANPKCGPDYSVVMTKSYIFYFQFYMASKMFSRTPGWGPLPQNSLVGVWFVTHDRRIIFMFPDLPQFAINSETTNHLGKLHRWHLRHLYIGLLGRWIGRSRWVQHWTREKSADTFLQRPGFDLTTKCWISKRPWEPEIWLSPWPEIVHIHTWVYLIKTSFVP
jgi:hypothetical protein